MAEQEKRYLVWCRTTYDGNSVLWWAPNRCGYTTDVDKAGRYDEKEARSIERLRGEDKAIPEEVALRVATRHVKADHLDKALREHEGT